MRSAVKLVTETVTGRVCLSDELLDPETSSG